MSLGQAFRPPVDPFDELLLHLRPIGPERELEGRWVVDASGRAAVLKRRFGLGVEVNHHCNAAWFRIGRRIEIDDWGSSDEWRSRVPSGTRWQSTNHLMGPGYWFWVIPLAGDSTSFGLVADPDLVPFEEMRRFEPLIELRRGASIRSIAGRLLLPPPPKPDQPHTP